MVTELAATPAPGYVDADDLDPGGLLDRAGAVLRERRAAEVEDLLLALRWADLHAWDPKAGAHRWTSGGNQLVEIGGDGTPLVQDLCLPELATARQVHTLSTRAHLADALDLRHRLPRVFALVLAGDCEVWLARRVAALSRALDRVAVSVVDDAVAEALPGESPGRVLSLCEAKVIEADRAAHAARLAEQLRRRYVGLGRTDVHGLRSLVARVEAGDAVWLDATVERVADALDARRDLVPDLPEDAARDELRAVALGWLAHPADVVALLDGEEETSRSPGRADLYVHLHQAALDGAAGVARVEDLGPLLLDQVRRLLGHSRVQLKPVIDLNTGASVNAYEFPEAARERVGLRCVGDAFPHARALNRRLDLDHAKPYSTTGPPGQTHDLNAAPLARRHHRAKTHLGFGVVQLDHADYLWRTPHGLRRRVDGSGTHELDDVQAQALLDPEALDRALDHAEQRARGAP